METGVKTEQVPNLYLLTLTDKGRHETPSYDVATRFVVRATSETSARLHAAERHGDEGRETWLESHLSNCQLIGVAVGDDANALTCGVVCRVYHAG